MEFLEMGTRIGWAYEYFVGAIPKGLQVHHSCDTPSCANPAHLWVGTQKENMEDMYRKGRNGHRSGSAHHCFGKVKSKATRKKLSRIKKEFWRSISTAKRNKLSSNISNVMKLYWEQRRIAGTLSTQPCPEKVRLKIARSMLGKRHSVKTKLKISKLSKAYWSKRRKEAA